MYPQIFGKYVLERELSRGGMARVLLATLRGAGGFEKKLVVKQILDELAVDQEFVQRFVQEAKTTVALSHPNIVPVYELGVELGTYYLAMEYVDGVSVNALLKSPEGKARGLSPEEGAYLGVEVCRGLDYAHRKMRVVHRDITPRNVMVDEEGQVKLIDFGIASRADLAEDGTSIPQAGLHDVFGTPGHMAPEQLDRKEIGPPADIFAVAVLLMEVWSGTPPFRRKTPAESLERMRGPHPSASESDPRLAPLDHVIASALALEPKERPQQADDLGRALRKFLQDVDLGDVARKLGARVREASAAAAAKAKAAGGGKGSLIKPSRPTLDMRPKTFAARAEVSAWAGDSGTRRLPESDAPPAGEVALAAGRASETPKIETVATRSVETRMETPRGRNVRSRATRALAMGALVVGVPAVAWGLMHYGGAPTQASSVRSTSTSTSTPTPTPTPTSTSTSTATPTPTPTSTSLTTPTPNGTASSATSRGHLALYGDLGTRVAIDGTPRGACPLRDIALEPGRHRVDFTFDPTGEGRSETLSVGPGERVTLRADFAGASPTIRVER